MLAPSIAGLAKVKREAASCHNIVYRWHPRPGVHGGGIREARAVQAVPTIGDQNISILLTSRNESTRTTFQIDRSSRSTETPSRSSMSPISISPSDWTKRPRLANGIHGRLATVVG